MSSFRVEPKYFIKFTKKYLLEYDSDKLYNIRCGIVHSYSNSMGYWFVDNKDWSKSFNGHTDFFGNLIFNIIKFRNDLSLAFNSYFIDLENDIDLQNSFDRRFKSLNIFSQSNIGVMRKFDPETKEIKEIIHNAKDLVKLDCGLPIAIKDIILIKQ